MSITRRDFLDGVALTVAAGLTPAAQLAAQPARYPPALMGLRGQHDGSFETAHAFAREGRRFDFASLPIEERYDLVVVGGGLERAGGGLVLPPQESAGAHPHSRQPRRFRRPRQAQRIHASASAASSAMAAASRSSRPIRSIGPAAKELLRELGVDIKRFETAFDRELYASLGLSRGLFFARETFGRDTLVPATRRG